MEVWKDIKGFEGFYKVSNKGNIIRVEHNITDKNGHIKKLKYKKMTKKTCKNGYISVHLKGLDFLVHRLVAQAFISNVNNKPCVNHKNSNRSDNFVENLEWCTHKENTEHAISNKRLKVKGKDNPASKLNNEKVKIIKEYIKQGKSNLEISKIFNVSRTAIYYIKVGKSWTHIQ